MNTTHYIHPNGKTTTPSNANITHIISGHPNINDYSARRLVGLGKNRPTKPQHIAKLLKFTTWQHRIKTGDEPKLYARMTAYPNNLHHSGARQHLHQPPFLHHRLKR